MPTDAVLYYRTNATRAALPTFDTVDELIASAAAQVIVFNDTDFSLISVEDQEQSNTSDDPGYSPDGSLLIEKQFNGTFGQNKILNIISDVTQTTLRNKLRQFARLVQIEPAYHEFGIFGFFHPKVSDFNLDPTNNFGYTMDQPIHKYPSGSEVVYTTVNLRLGGKLNLIP